MSPSDKFPGQAQAFDIKALQTEAMRDGLWLTALFFLLFRRRLSRWAIEAAKSTAPRPKRSPFIYELR